MRKNLMRSALGLLAFMFIVIVVGRLVIVAQVPITGTWTANTRSSEKELKVENANKVNLSFERQTAHGRNQNGQSYTFDELRGLTRAQSENGSVNFSLVREAGTIECEGTFTNGKGSGTFRFTPNQSYLDGMKARGFDFEKSAKYGDDDDSRILTAALVNVTTVLADDLKSSGFIIDVDDLFKAAIFKVDSKFMAEMKATGFPDLKMEDLVKARIFNIDAGFVKKMADSGYGTKDFEQLVKYSIHKVTPEYLTELKAAGFDKLSAEEVVKFRIFNVTPELLSEIKNEGLTNLSAEQVVKLKIFNIDKDFMRKAKAEDPNITVEEMVKMKIGVRRTRSSN